MWHFINKSKLNSISLINHKSLANEDGVTQSLSLAMYGCAEQGFFCQAEVLLNKDLGQNIALFFFNNKLQFQAWFLDTLKVR